MESLVKFKEKYFINIGYKLVSKKRISELKVNKYDF